FPALLKDISRKGWEAVVQTNLTGGFLMARECLNQAMQKTGGAIVNIVADMWGGMPGMGHSGAARAGMVNFTETAAFEWAQYGVRVNAVAPGYVASSGLDAYPPEAREMILQIGKQVPLQRLASEAEISAAIVFLLSEAASFITGAVLRVDGGRPNVRLGFPLEVQRSTPAFNGFHLARKPRVLEEE
ncbi:MAG: SDR family oxidoreductase, partial [Bacillota bacterium]